MSTTLTLDWLVRQSAQTRFCDEIFVRYLGRDGWAIAKADLPETGAVHGERMEALATALTELIVQMWRGSVAWPMRFVPPHPNDVAAAYEQIRPLIVEAGLIRDPEVVKAENEQLVKDGIWRLNNLKAEALGRASGNVVLP